MLNPLYFDASVTDGELRKIFDDSWQRQAFVGFCASEVSLENYIALMCIMAFRKKPTLLRVQTFYVAFLKGTNSPLDPIPLG